MAQCCCPPALALLRRQGEGSEGNGEEQGCREETGNAAQEEIDQQQQGNSVTMRDLLELSGPIHKPGSGRKPKQLVVLLHGYGSDGNDLIGLAPHWASLLPEAEF